MNVGIRLQCGKVGTGEESVQSAADMIHAGTCTPIESMDAGRTVGEIYFGKSEILLFI
jgi:hypothetical protein